MTASRPQPGDMIANKYRVERLLGEGGMGYVVQATHTLLDETVALKFLLPEVAQHDDACERFLREAKAARRIKGQHIADILDVGKLDSGEPFIAMEFLEGQDLHAAIDDSGPLPVPLAVMVILHACEGLARAHAAGIVHRDMKPSNLFMTTDEHGQPLVKILDFGISKLDEAGAPRLTATSAAMGSALYMAPEQMRSARDADPRSDIYALGVTLFELLTGRVPYDGTTMTEVVASVLEGKAHRITTFRHDLPVGLDAVVHRAMATSPEQRFARVEDLAAALRPFASADHVAQAPTLAIPAASAPVAAPVAAAPAAPVPAAAVPAAAVPVAPAPVAPVPAAPVPAAPVPAAAQRATLPSHAPPEPRPAEPFGTAAAHTMASATDPRQPLGHTFGSLTRTAPESRAGYQPKKAERTWMYALGAVLLFGVVATVTAVQLLSSPAGESAASEAARSKGNEAKKKKKKRTEQPASEVAPSTSADAPSADSAAPSASSSAEPALVPTASAVAAPRFPVAPKPKFPRKPRRRRRPKDMYEGRK